ncbi:S-disulfanyl-L-cysteine oxidoreductase SoxD [Myxococcaceae bacterium]|jgi:cytochrome c|nr:S-disulfanyl-L-cysteine oxidoreductase SoxD [Myxococcaceae bacterium]
MSTRNRAWIAATAIALATSGAEAEGPGLGVPLAPGEIPRFASVVLPDGAGLPPGRGTAREGASIYAAKCARCHGVTGTEGPIQPPVAPARQYAKPAGRHWPHATTLFDYTKRAMPFDAPKSLSDDEAYAVVAWILYRNGLVAEDEIVDAKSLPRVEMPNRSNTIDLYERQGEKPY